MVELTKSGVFIRDDKELGARVFSPFTGLFFNVPEQDVPKVKAWLNRSSDDVDIYYKTTIGLEWDINFQDAYTLTPSDAFDIMPDRVIRLPMVINWILTGQCTHKCSYCYAADMRNTPSTLISKEAVDIIIERILSYEPIAVVLSGGEPLLCKFLDYIIEQLYDKVGLILDTNGHLLNEERLHFLNKYNVVIRISVDSLISKNEKKFRTFGSSKLDKEELNITIEALNLCLRNEAKVIVHTVVTTANVNDLLSMGEKLYSLGVKVWKLMELACFDKKRLLPFHIEHEKFRKVFLSRLHMRERSQWNQRMRIIYQRNKPNIPNSTILVNPKGEFVFQSIENGKIPIDNENPFQPTLDKIYTCIDLWEHQRRYFGEV